MVIDIGQVVKENYLVPVTTEPKVTGKLGELLKSVRRSTVDHRDLVCVLVSPKGDMGVYLDEKGNEYILTDKDLKQSLTYVDSGYLKREVPRFKALKKAFKYEKLVSSFLDRGDVTTRYKGWVSSLDIEDSTEKESQPLILQKREEVLVMNEEKYKKGEKWISDDGEWSFEVIAVKGGHVKVRDLGNNKTYLIELSDIELMNPHKLR